MVNTPNDVQPTAPAQQIQQPADSKKRNKYLWIFSGIILLLAIIWLLLYLLYFQYYQYTDDAYSNGNMININPAISGSVVAFYADNTDLVVEGQLLAELDKTAYKVSYDHALESLAATVLQVRQLYDDVAASKAGFENAAITLARAKYDFDNRAKLVDSEAISKQDFVHSRDDVATAQAAYKQAEARLAVSLAAAGNTPIEEHPLLLQAKSNVRQAFYNLEHTAIYAPSTGYVAQRTVDVGQWVSPQTPLMAVIPTDYVWVDANYKETQLTYMRVGQPATVTFDMYGSDVVYHGKVLGIASGSGSVFSLIPPQNATGNWIKIVQRLPVRISLDPETVKKYPVRLGISAEVDVDITNQDLPRLTTQPPSKPIAVTDVFNLQFDKINQLIEKIVQENLKKAEVDTERVSRIGFLAKRKLPLLNDRKVANISNMNTFSIVQPRDFGLLEIPIFETRSV